MISFQKVDLPHGGQVERFTLQIDHFEPEDWLYLVINQIDLIYHASFNEDNNQVLYSIRNAASFLNHLMPDGEQMHQIWTTNASATDTNEARQFSRLFRENLTANAAAYQSQNLDFFGKPKQQPQPAETPAARAIEAIEKDFGERLENLARSVRAKQKPPSEQSAAGDENQS